ncbi:maleylpyruvate isomerase family mycothiol-dependent enzyme [Nocardioides lentus]|uniref:Maleylpyruvate isomerase family mycothiol-dependent enzyme n=1 Tax=Nocardioides lentus TaxID=338077 RepID=A0ABN2NZV4_9ACTN
MTGPPPTTPRPPDLPDLDAAVELLERALGHTRLALAGVRPVHLARPTPCARWDLDDLLWHMDDALDAFTEAAAGRVTGRGTGRGSPGRSGTARTPGAAGPRATGVGARLGRLQTKACHLLGLWAEPPRSVVDVGAIDVGAVDVGAVDVGAVDVGAVDRAGTSLPASLLVATAALEIGVHGWDVAQATGEDRPVPADLAAQLLPVAAVTIGARDRGRRFGSSLPVAPFAPADVRLLAFLGRPPLPARAG